MWLDRYYEGGDVGRGLDRKLIESITGCVNVCDVMWCMYLDRVWFARHESIFVELLIECITWCGYV